MAAQQQRQTDTSTGIFNHEKHISAASSQSSITIASKGVTSKSSMISAANAVNQLMNGIRPAEDELLSLPLDDLDLLCSKSNPQDVDRAIAKYPSFLDSFVERLKANDCKNGKAPLLLNRVNEIIRKAWAVPTHGHELGYILCNTLRTRGGLDLLLSNCIASDHELRFSLARLLEQCLTTENRAHVVERGLEKVVNVACVCTKNANSVDHSRVGTGILEHLFKHSEGTCSDVIRLGGLDAVLFECRKNDVETLRHCAGALANLSLYGGAENQKAMIRRKVPMWLFPLAFHNDDNIKYYACLAIAVLVANKEIEAAVLKSGTLDLVEPFVTSHNPYEFAKSNLAHAHGQSKNWLEWLVPVLSSKREEARNLAAFHLCFNWLRKSSSLSRWLMRFPPTFLRLKFTRTQPGGSPLPRRPPLHPPSSSTRSRSLELLDQDEKTSISPVKEPEVQARPRSNSLDGLLDEDGLVSDMKTEDSLISSIENKIDSRISSEVLM
ncbi:PREDICTED: LOW QUALITY PROTEIN: sterile alpha and TIR motif-containing protein 1-like [Eufriesea mexicana]|uniref:LOW QUALITY PROTEIN: sterile alpha and TIR motif-containing protein 1-like n=1 Tax=Eufriesea mexicana TaxID=516756 RepID=UPI00083C61E7|nr:PREDICTED: LOW QUALITY PROTEIN: sterile alpha and TIR motif-containing protein 1-like [Eufriesea mexicana]